MSASPVPALGNGALLAEAHEARLQRLETGMSEVVARVGEHGVKLDYLGQTLEDGITRLGEKMEACVRPVSERLDAVTGRSRALEMRVTAHQEVVDRLIAEETSRAGRRRWLVRSGLALALAGLGATAGEAGKWLWGLIR
jgi:hypothetical protein